MKNPNASKALRLANYKRWRKERGIKLIIEISPLRKGIHKGLCIFEGNTYASTGKTNVEALENLMSLLITKKAIE